MTNDQWTYVSAKLTALEVVVLAIAKASPNPEEVKRQIQAQLDTHEAALTFSELPEQQVSAIKRYISEISNEV